MAEVSTARSRPVSNIHGDFAAARCLRRGDPLGALQWVGRRQDAMGRALRGVAMAQLGELAVARKLLREAIADADLDEHTRARCALAEAEVALSMREFDGLEQRLAQAGETFSGEGDSDNATWTQVLRARSALLSGAPRQALSILASTDHTDRAPAIMAMASLVAAQAHASRLAADAASASVARATEHAARSGLGSLVREVEAYRRQLGSPAARVRHRDQERTVTLAEVEALVASGALIVDGCRRVVQHHAVQIQLTNRPVLLTLARVLAEAWPAPASRDVLARAAFELSARDPGVAPRLRVEIGRLRAMVHEVAGIRADDDGFVLEARSWTEARALAPMTDSADGRIEALLADRAAWSTRALARALGKSPRTVQRTLAAMLREGRVMALGDGRARRWVAPDPADGCWALLLPTD